MTNQTTTTVTKCTAFAGMHRIATGDIATVARAVKDTLTANPLAQVLIFDTTTSQQLELDLRGSWEEVLARLTPPVIPEVPVTLLPGRPKLGVVAREVTLLPRHWEWLATQPGGASVALRKLVEEARKANAWQDALREQQEVTYRFLAAIAGDLPHFEEATRALFASDWEAFTLHIATWPADISDHALTLLKVQ